MGISHSCGGGESTSEICLNQQPSNFRKKGMHSEILAKIVHRELIPLVQKMYKIKLHTITADNTIVNLADLVKNMILYLIWDVAMPGCNRVLQIEHILLVYLKRDYVINTSNNNFLH